MSDDDSTAGMATGSDAGAPGEGSASSPAPGDGAVLDALLTDDGDDVIAPVEDSREMAEAADDDAPLGALAADDGADADTVTFREPATD